MLLVSALRVNLSFRSQRMIASCCPLLPNAPMEQSQRSEIRSSPTTSAIANAGSAPSSRSYDLKESLAGFLSVISKSCRGQQNIDDILNHAQKTLQRAERTAGKNPSLENDDGVGIGVSTSRITEEVGDDSDVDPDQIEIEAQSDFKRTSVRTACDGNTDRGIRAQRRAAEADGLELPAALMINRKPVLKEHKEEVTLKVRNARIMYTFVKSRNEKLKGLREQLELLAELPRHLKIELQYRRHVIRDSDTPASLGIDDRGRLRAKRKERIPGDSSDDVTEVERKRHRKNLLKVTIQDEKGKKHDFQHDRDTKLGSMFRAFARLCQNDVLSYRFFLDGVRLSNDNKPADCEDFEDGALIDAFFEAQGGTHTHYRCSRPRFHQLVRHPTNCQIRQK